MKPRHFLKVFNDEGDSIGEIAQFSRLGYYRAANDIGGFELVVPPDLSTEMIDVDHQIEIWRQPYGGRRKLQTVGFMRAWEWFETNDGEERLWIAGPDQNDLLDRRIVAYYAGDAEASKTDYADDMLKEIVDENMGPSAPLDEAGRPRACDPDYFTIQAQSSLAPEVTRSFPWRRVMPVLQEIANASADLGTPLYFDMTPGASPGRYEFRTFTEILGLDASVDGDMSQPAIFSKKLGNLLEPRLLVDWRDERNYVYGGGAGSGASRMIDPEDDVWRMRRSIWNRRECFEDAREEDTLLGVATKAYARMQAERPRIRMRGRLLDTPNARWGVDWDYGHKVTLNHKGQEFSGMISSYYMEIDENGFEDLKVRMEIEYATG